MNTLIAICFATSSPETALVQLIERLELVVAAEDKNQPDTLSFDALLAAIEGETFASEAFSDLCDAKNALRDLRAKKEEELLAAARQEHESNCCGRCGGKGKIASYAYYQGGVCFSCGGSGLAGVADAAAVAYEDFTGNAPTFA